MRTNICGFHQNSRSRWFQVWLYVEMLWRGVEIKWMGFFYFILRHSFLIKGGLVISLWWIREGTDIYHSKAGWVTVWCEAVIWISCWWISIISFGRSGIQCYWLLLRNKWLERFALHSGNRYVMWMCWLHLIKRWSIVFVICDYFLKHSLELADLLLVWTVRVICVELLVGLVIFRFVGYQILMFCISKLLLNLANGHTSVFFVTYFAGF